MAPAVLQVVGSGGNGTSTFDTFAQAYNASTSNNDVIQIEPSAGDAGSITLNDSNKAITVRGDPNFRTGPSVEAVDDITFNVPFQRTSLVHVYVNGTFTVTENVINGVQIIDANLNNFAETLPPGNAANGMNIFLFDEIRGDVFLQDSGAEQILNCDFKAGSQLRMGTAGQGVASLTVSNCIFEPSPTTSIVMTDSENLTMDDSRVSLTTASDAVLSNGLNGFRRDDIRTQSGTGIRVSVSSNGPVIGGGLLAEATAFQGNDTAIAFAARSDALPGSTIDAGGGTEFTELPFLNSMGGNEFNVNMTTGVMVDAPAITANHLTVFSNGNAVGPGVTPVAVTSGNVAVNQGMNLSPAQSFVQGLYHVYLTHTANLDELNGWVNVLPNLGTQGVSQAIAHSHEALTRLVDHLYQQLLSRDADAAGRDALVQALQAGATEEQVIAGLLNSPEFAARANGLTGLPGTDPNLNFVRALYLKLLSRTNESAADDSAWLALLGTMGKGAVVVGFLQSLEFRNDYVDALYTSYTVLAGSSYFGAVPDMLCRPAQPSTAEASAWSNTNLDMLGIAASISASNEFFMNR